MATTDTKSRLAPEGKVTEILKPILLTLRRSHDDSFIRLLSILKIKIP